MEEQPANKDTPTNSPRQTMVLRCDMMLSLRKCRRGKSTSGKTAVWPPDERANTWADREKL